MFVIQRGVNSSGALVHFNGEFENKMWERGSFNDLEHFQRDAKIFLGGTTLIKIRNKKIDPEAIMDQ